MAMAMAFPSGVTFDLKTIAMFGRPMTSTDTASGSITISSISPTIGGEIGGVDLREPLSDRLRAELRLAPALGSVLRMKTVPPVGGDTIFADMGAAYDGLSDEIKDEIDGRVARHDFESHASTLMGIASPIGS